MTRNKAAADSGTRIAVVVAHPDDEVLLAGGCIALHAAQGHTVDILFTASGGSARNGDQSAYISRLKDQARRAAELLGVTSVEFHDWPDNRMDSVPLLDVVQRLESFLATKQPNVIFTHHAGDLNVDHRITSRAVVTALRPIAGSYATTILAGETNSSTEWEPPGPQAFQPMEFFDISPFLALKLDALSCYTDELRPWPHPRSLEGVRALATWRGTQSGLNAAEAFATVRRIHRRAE
jgi:N-acetylglucosamine malate deacetylase 1